jgi:hypothetical protein
MEDPANELRRIPLPRTWVHKEKPRVFVQQALSRCVLRGWLR